MNLIKNSGAKIIILSSNFVQRASPAFINKFSRAEMAVNSGAHVVIELPFIFSCSAATDFANYSVDILAKSHLADSIAFGMENPEFNFKNTAQILNEESEFFKNILNFNLDSGMSFPKAVAETLEILKPGAKNFISKPNNLLATLYTKRILQMNYKLNIKPFLRTGNFSSKIIREDLKNNLNLLPDFSQNIINRDISNGRLCENYKNKLWLLLHGLLLRSSPEDLKLIHGFNEGLENLFFRNIYKAKNYDEFINLSTSSRYTNSHIRRRIIYALIGLKKFENVSPNYARILAFTQEGRKLLHNAKPEIKFITRFSELKNNFIAETELKASKLYELLLDNQNFKSEFESVMKFF